MGVTEGDITMAGVGINVAMSGRHMGTWLEDLGAQGARIVLSPRVDLTQRLADWRDHNIGPLLVLARESIEPFGPVDSAHIAETCKTALIQYITRYMTFDPYWQIGNEPDGVGESSWIMKPSDFFALGDMARYVLGRSAHIVAGGFNSGNPYWTDWETLTWADYIGVHPYTKTADGDIQQLCQAYRDLFSKPVIVSEWGWPSDSNEEAASEIRKAITWARATQDIGAFYYFCADDAMVPPFGLCTAQGVAKPQGNAFRDAMLSGPPGPRNFTLQKYALEVADKLNEYAAELRRLASS